MNFLVTLLKWFAFGAAFAAGAGALMIGWNIAKEHVIAQPSEMVRNPEELTVVAVEPMAVTIPAGVVVTVKNMSTKSAYSPVGYNIRLLNGESQLARCSPRYESIQIQPGATAKVQLICPDIERAALPIGVTYKLSITDAWRFL
jgi:hypothetical protein